MSEATTRWQAQRIEELEAEIAELRAKQKLPSDVHEAARRLVRGKGQTQYGRNWGVKTVARLYVAYPRVVSREALVQELGPNVCAESCASVAAWRARKALPPGSIETTWGVGYRLTATGRAAVQAEIDAMHHEQQETDRAQNV
jgi:hypothetical protein